MTPIKFLHIDMEQLLKNIHLILCTVRRKPTVAEKTPNILYTPNLLVKYSLYLGLHIFMIFSPLKINKNKYNCSLTDINLQSVVGISASNLTPDFKKII